MKKILALLFSVMCLCICSCDPDKGDDSDSLPPTDCSVFHKNNQLVFPEGTSALELYNCLVSEMGVGEHSINGIYTYTESAVLNGVNHSETVKKNINAVKIYKSNTEASNLFHVDFITDDADTNKKLQFYYQWQHCNTNVWNNNKSDGEIIIAII